MNRDYDYCDTYDSYYNGITLDNKNEIKTFSCKCCNKPKLILKKSVGDPGFKCEECIEEQGQQETGWRWFGFF
jgi:hypothetical protein